MEDMATKTIKIFLASSGELSEERKEVALFIGRENKALVKKNLVTGTYNST